MGETVHLEEVESTRIKNTRESPAENNLFL
jgi:hypothetical protein